jgi:protein-export membrane protein SecD
MDQARQIVDRRVNGLGVVEPVVQISGGNRILVELPGISDPKAAIDTIRQTGLLEFVDFRPNTPSCTTAFPSSGQYILTDRQVALRGAQPAATATSAATAAATGAPSSTPAPTTVPTSAASATSSPTMAATGALDNVSGSDLRFKPAQGTPAATAQPTAQPSATPAGTQAATTPSGTQAATPQSTVPATGDGTKDHPLLNPCTGQPFSTIMTGAGLQNAEAGLGGTGSTEYVVNFQLQTNEEAQRFGTHTANNVGYPMAIVLDGQVLSAPVIRAALTTGGQISGGFTAPKAQELALQLRYGALPVSLHVESTEQVGASLGAESIQASVRAGLIGILIVLIFMLAMYRLPGLAACLALLLFALINFALYKFIPVTLTLPSIIGFMISVGTAVDGNILIFERIKEELRAGRTGDKAIELGFARAWPSIRDSNISTIVVALIVYFFGGQFGAGAVRGFAITLILGLLTNLFTAVIVTHTFMNVIMRFVGPGLRSSALFTNYGKVRE